MAEACGQSSEQLRSCLRRLVAEGLFEREGTGKGAVYAATEAGMAALGQSVERQRLAYAQDAAGRGWDRHWRLVAFAIPEVRRAARDAFRDRLLALGGAAIHNGLYVSAHRWDKDALGEAERLDVTEHVTVASTEDLEVGGVRDPRELALRLWPVDELAARYQRFIDTYRDTPDAAQPRCAPATSASPTPTSSRRRWPWGWRSRSASTTTRCCRPSCSPVRGRVVRRASSSCARGGLALQIRAAHDRPRLFRTFDDLLESIP